MPAAVTTLRCPRVASEQDAGVPGFELPQGLLACPADGDDEVDSVPREWIAELPALSSPAGMHDGPRTWVAHSRKEIMASHAVRPRGDSGGFWVKNKGSKPDRRSSLLVMVAALAAVAMLAGRAARTRHRGKRSS